MLPIESHTHFIQINLSDLLIELGEDETKSILSSFSVSAPLIGQLGKNFANGNNTLISGDELLKLAIDKVKSIQYEIGGKFVYLECEDNEKLKNFYQRNNFKIFGTRNLDRDETNIKGDYLVQLFAML